MRHAGLLWSSLPVCTVGAPVFSDPRENFGFDVNAAAIAHQLAKSTEA
jgi:hypothetical protein